MHRRMREALFKMLAWQAFAALALLAAVVAAVAVQWFIPYFVAFAAQLSSMWEK